MKKIPPDFSEDIKKGISLLKQIGCTEIYLFGSAARGNTTETSDIDFAVRSCPADKFYYAVGKLLSELGRSVDLIDLERDTRFGDFLLTTGELIRVA